MEMRDSNPKVIQRLYINSVSKLPLPGRCGDYIVGGEERGMGGGGVGVLEWVSKG